MCALIKYSFDLAIFEDKEDDENDEDDNALELEDEDD